MSDEHLRIMDRWEISAKQEGQKNDMRHAPFRLLPNTLKCSSILVPRRSRSHCLCAATASSVCRILQRQSLGRAHQCAKQCRQNSRTFTDRSAKPVPWKPTHAAPTARLATKVTQMSKELHRIRLGPRRLRIHTNTRTMQTSNHRKRRNWKIRRHPSSISSSRPSNPAQT